ncbi:MULTISPECIES: SDR family NAD(P)-dependent oxidoreductase [unclassified Novosphingobium]|uniref:SDR family NAD(P)-dependent oxidoreductase n=1 Tax=unclassified Novosphingobium TaxID=2644732 RepID=UPI000D3238D3|nr:MULTISPECIES: SDR family oxidoreductase [unclassified Novosphingobium]PTR11467.1 NAD(P)-dependent dehydrogenase (short-subunit alcohol dehydrogenase family) [Novosphingobium sp. GV055]PUB04248.1 NAD(P)-dependent dehydrogenase (short-subunit alcohol dehydrogenase family) [Novosphingobium sp. GV061]PUB20639.1 NAD(P)-dependent dehydrogenase (short-subunit alcohol dehydrogenase family) [Novosphingobium sp. GV079]PUB42365.1 NAD(P)-dependent dehydrogenase (short-subunit alcohol dehydrogenase famil
MTTAASTIVITGAGAGIGRGTALHFAALGWRVVALDRDAKALKELGAMLPRGQGLTIACEVGREKPVARAFARIAAWAGDGIDCLVNNAGIADPYCGPLEDLALADWQRWIDASLTAAFLCSRAALPLLQRRSGASVVNIASTRALQSEPDTYAYAAAKGGLCALTHAMAVGLGPKVRVNAVLPGWIETGPWQRADRAHEPDHRAVDREQHPAGRVGTVQDIATTIAWLASPDAGFVTGQQIAVDGGMTRKMIYAE